MANYFATYQGTFNNRLNNEVVVTIARKDIPVDVDDIIQVRIVDVIIDYPNGDESKYQSIISQVAKISIYSGIEDSFTNETFLTDYYDEWKVTITCDTLKVFEGFVEPSGRGYFLKDRPFIVEIDCSDGLGLLKNVPLSNRIGNNFSGNSNLMAYIVGALAKTNHELNIRTYCNLFNDDMIDRSTAEDADMFWQVDVSHRTFLESPNQYMNCYEALEKILEGFSLFYWNGRWVISYRPDLINESGANCYWTEYDYTGQTIDAGQDTNSATHISRNRIIYSTQANQLVSYQPAVRQVRTNYNYEIPPELINNDKILQLGNFIAPVLGYELVGWTQVQGDPTVRANYGGTKRAYVKVENDIYNREIQRYFVVEYDGAVTGQLRHHIVHSNSDFYVYQGDKINITITARFTGTALAINHSKVALFIGGDPAVQSNWYTLNSNTGLWTNNDDVAFGDASLDFSDSSVSDIVIPFDGKLFIFLGAVGGSGITATHYKYPRIEYTPYLAGSEVEVKGDYWLTSQDQNIKDVIVDTVYVSDTIRKLFKGAFFKTGTEDLMNPTWYRYGVSESRSYKALLSIGKYQHYKRRFKKIAGSFKGLLQSPENNQLDFSPLSFHKHFIFTDDSKSKRYVLVPPLKIDYREGTFEGIFIECYKDSDDAVNNWDVHKFAYIF